MYGQLFPPSPPTKKKQVALKLTRMWTGAKLFARWLSLSPPREIIQSQAQENSVRPAEKLNNNKKKETQSDGAAVRILKAERCAPRLGRERCDSDGGRMKGGRLQLCVAP